MGLPHLDCVAGLGEEAAERAGAGGGQFDRRLVGLNVADNFAARDGRAVIRQPFDEGSFLHRIAHLGHDHFNHVRLDSTEATMTLQYEQSQIRIWQPIRRFAVIRLKADLDVRHEQYN